MSCKPNSTPTATAAPGSEPTSPILAHVIHQLMQEKKAMRKSIEALVDRVGTTVTQNYTLQNNIFIHSHGSENLDYISSQYLLNLVKAPYGAVPQLLKDIHFHPEHPENANVVITNKKLQYAKVWKNDKWNVCDKKEVIHNMMDKSFNIIDGSFESGIDSLDSRKKQKYMEFQHKYASHNKQLYKDLFKDTEILIINNSGPKSQSLP